MSMGMDWGMSMGKGGKDKGGKGGKGGKGKGKSIQSLKSSLITAGALPGGKYMNDNDNALFVGSLPNDTTTEDLYEIFSPFGAIAAKGCRAMYDDWGQCK